MQYLGQIIRGEIVDIVLIGEEFRSFLEEQFQDKDNLHTIPK